MKRLLCATSPAHVCRSALLYRHRVQVGCLLKTAAALSHQQHWLRPAESRVSTSATSAECSCRCSPLCSPAGQAVSRVTSSAGASSSSGGSFSPQSYCRYYNCGTSSGVHRAMRGVAARAAGSGAAKSGASETSQG
jgi:hypothetical protein